METTKKNTREREKKEKKKNTLNRENKDAAAVFETQNRTRRLENISRAGLLCILRHPLVRTV